MIHREIARITVAYKRIRDDLIGRPAEVRGRPEIDGTVIGVNLNPQGVVVVTLRARDTTTPRKPRAKAYPLRLRLPAESCTFGERPPPPVRRRAPRFARAIVEREFGTALDRMGRLVGL